MVDPTPLMVGLAAGAVGAVPPGPLSIALMHRGASGDRGVWLFAGLGGAVTHLIFLIAVGLGTTPVLLTLAERGIVRLVLSACVIAWAAALVAKDRVRPRAQLAEGPEASSAPFGVAVRGGSAMEAQVLSFGMLAAKWIVVLGFALAHGPLVLGTQPLLLFAAGVWLGVLAWFALLPRLGARAGTAGIGALARTASYVASGAMAIAGLAGIVRGVG